MDFEIEHIKAINGKIFALLSDGEQALFHYFMTQGRKFGISVTVDGKKYLTENEQSLIKSNSNARVVVIDENVSDN